MINTNMRSYDFFSLDREDEYGQPIPTAKVGAAKMSINLQTQMVNDNIKYKDANYVALTLDNRITDKHIIQYDEETKLKVLYVNRFGRFNQLYLSEML